LRDTPMAATAPPPRAAPATGFTSLLDPRALAKISRMELVARQVMDGFVQGMHRSPHVGFALDFAQHRPYVPGDDIKRIDWRVFAKADRYYIKQYEVSTNLRCHVVLDASGSMAYRGAADALGKFRYAQFVAACLCYLVLHQQDSAGLITFDTKIRDYLPARSNATHLMRLLRALDETKPANESGIAPILHELADRVPRRGMVIVVSDLFDDAGAIVEALHHLRHRRHEVLLMQVMADDELTFPFRKWSLFENLERQDHRVRLDPATMRSAYLASVNRHQKTIREAAGRLNVSHVLLNTSRPFDEALTNYLAARVGWK
jgi:uncharacterized protein (DUF58 family)